MLLAKILWQAGSVVFTLLAGMHLYLTFFTNKFSSRNKRLMEDMQTSSPILSNEITMWKAWIGFNGSHSSGGLFIGIINFYLASRYFSILQADPFFPIFTIATLGFYVWLAKKYWFKTALTGLTISFSCYIVAYSLILFSR